ncbi:hypothetical protein IFM89_013727 [Coptis chinensis]|uniref:Uncharacterized protein n=1 Tax=Coptis chinensis TaxID=261450 RepID=A0A835HVA7_9MAGN|nr:hypothetical protein IFM89_013727 [Coptis chinensis]
MDTGMGMVKEGSDPEHDGAQATKGGLFKVQRKCSPFFVYAKPFVMDLSPGTPYNQRVANSQRGVITSWIRDRDNVVSSFQIVILEGYGMTETSCVISSMDEADTLSGHVGSPIPACGLFITWVKNMAFFCSFFFLGMTID